jgi:hypothetical protein
MSHFRDETWDRFCEIKWAFLFKQNCTRIPLFEPSCCGGDRLGELEPSPRPSTGHWASQVSPRGCQLSVSLVENGALVCFRMTCAPTWRVELGLRCTVRCKAFGSSGIDVLGQYESVESCSQEVSKAQQMRKSLGPWSALTSHCAWQGTAFEALHSQQSRFSFSLLFIFLSFTPPYPEHRLNKNSHFGIIFFKPTIRLP